MAARVDHKPANRLGPIAGFREARYSLDTAHRGLDKTAADSRLLKRIGLRFDRLRGCVDGTLYEGSRSGCQYPACYRHRGKYLADPSQNGGTCSDSGHWIIVFAFVDSRENRLDWTRAWSFSSCHVCRFCYDHRSFQT